MSESDTKNTVVQDNMIVTLDYALKVDDQIVDDSKDNGPIRFLQGAGQIVTGLERALYGMEVGERKQVIIQPAEGYGEYDENGYAEIPRSEFPASIPLEAGVQLQLRDRDGDIFEAYIDEIQEDSVLLNFNHPLAGKVLDFAVTVIALRQATEEEIEHGHVHDDED